MFRKHLFYLSSDQLSAYLWERGQLSAGPVFSNDRAGIDAFMDYVDSLGYVPAYLLADLIEEDFQRASLPHVTGRAGRNLLERRLLQQYRETPYRAAAIQGRDTDGRMDDQALLSGLTNPGLVQPWLQALEMLRAPVAGLYSATLMSPYLLKKLGLQEEHLLLVSQQSAGLRQSYFQNGLLKFSRLTLAEDRDGEPVNLARETEKTQQFLTSVRLIGRGDVLHTVVLTPSEQIERLQEQCHNGAETAYEFLAMESAAIKLGLPRAPELADTFLLTLLGRELPASQYALGEAQRYFKLWRARLSLYAVSATVALLSLVWIGANFWRYFDAMGAADRAYAEADHYDVRYKEALSSMPPAVSRTANMKAAVTVEQMLMRQGPQPFPIMSKLSDALDKVPSIRVTLLEWKVNLPGVKAGPSEGPGAMPSGAPGEVLDPISSTMLGIPAAPPQALRVEAEIDVAQDNYRNVVDSMNSFTQELARQPRMTVEIEQLPVDTRSNVRLSGKAGSVSGGVESKAKFIINLVWNP